MEFPDKSNPIQGQPPKKEITPVVKNASQIKRPATKRFLDYVLAESPKALGRKIAQDVIVPRLKAGFEEAANSFLAGMLWGDSANRPMSNIVRGTVLRGGHVPYSSISSNPSMAQAMMAANQARSAGNYQDLVVPSMQEAELLLVNLYDLLNQYRVVTVADLYELASITPQISDNGYGWTNLEGARISKVRDGYSLELPRPSII